jgi:hypothetical protein
VESSGNTRKRQLRRRRGRAVQMLRVKVSVQRFRRRMRKLSLRTNSSAARPAYVVTERVASSGPTGTSMSASITEYLTLLPHARNVVRESNQTEAETGAASLTTSTKMN